MKKIIIVVVILFMCNVASAVNLSELQVNQDKIDQCRKLEDKLRDFISFAMNGYKYTYCDPSDLEMVCEQRELTVGQKQAMKAKAKAIDNQLYILETERHNWIQGL